MNAPQSPSEPASDPRRLWAALGCVEPADWNHAAVVGRVPCLELDWRQHAKRGVSTLSVMEDLEPLDCHGLPADLGRSPGRAVNGSHLLALVRAGACSEGSWSSARTSWNRKAAT